MEPTGSSGKREKRTELGCILEVEPIGITNGDDGGWGRCGRGALKGVSEVLGSASYLGLAGRNAFYRKGMWGKKRQV